MHGLLFNVRALGTVGSVFDLLSFCRRYHGIFLPIEREMASEISSIGERVMCENKSIKPKLVAMSFLRRATREREEK